MKKTLQFTRETSAAARDVAIRKAHETYSRRIAEIEEFEQRILAPPKQAIPASLDEWAWRLKEEGKTHKQIAEETGTAASTVGMRLRRYEWKISTNRPPQLSTRAANVIWNSGLDFADIGKIAEWFKSAKFGYNFGKKTELEVYCWLKSLNAID